MRTFCDLCGYPARSAQPQPLCPCCQKRLDLSERRYEELNQGGQYWNLSRDDPFERDWLLSRELFIAYRDFAPRFGTLIHRVLGGDVFDYNGGQAIWVQAWIAPGELIVAYPSSGERYSVPYEGEGLHEFEGWIHRLRHSELLGVGSAPDSRSRYAASWSGEPGRSPSVKWAARGDWSALARHWHWSALTERLTGTNAS
jgi:hypothetical protein